VVFAPIRVSAVRVRALWGSPLQGWRVSFDAGANTGGRKKLRPYSCRAPSPLFYFLLAPLGRLLFTCAKRLGYKKNLRCDRLSYRSCG
jgi:hypothetical protein